MAWDAWQLRSLMCTAGELQRCIFCCLGRDVAGCSEVRWDACETWPNLGFCALQRAWRVVPLVCLAFSPAAACQLPEVRTKAMHEWSHALPAACCTPHALLCSGDAAVIQETVKRNAIFTNLDNQVSWEAPIKPPPLSQIPRSCRKAAFLVLQVPIKQPLPSHPRVDLKAAAFPFLPSCPPAHRWRA